MRSLIHNPEPDSPLASAYAYCERIARQHYENFPVASRLLPAAMRPHIAAIYAFARRADDFADEPGLADADRLRLLDDWGRRLQGQTPVRGGQTSEKKPTYGGLTLETPTYGGGTLHDRGQTPDERHTQGYGGQTPDGRHTQGYEGQTPESDDLIFCALGNTIREHSLPISLFEDLLSAFRQDVVTTRYAAWDDVLDYCRRSANPVGRLVLRVAGYDNPRLDAHSDAVCTALQLTNFWQDLAVDWSRGRLYVPLTDRDRAGAADADLDAGTLTPEWEGALRAVAARTRELFDRGRPVCDAVRGRLRWELRLTWLGASRVLDKLDAIGFDVFHHRPSLTTSDAPALVWQAIRWRRVPLTPDATGTVRLKPDATGTVRLKPDATGTVRRKPDATGTVRLGAGATDEVRLKPHNTETKPDATKTP
jgi:squalene synthase HpnC